MPHILTLNQPGSLAIWRIGGAIDRGCEMRLASLEFTCHMWKPTARQRTVVWPIAIAVILGALVVWPFDAARPNMRGV